MNVDPLYVDSEPWPDTGPDIEGGAQVYAAGWLTALAAVAAALVLVLLVRRTRVH